MDKETLSEQNKVIEEKIMTELQNVFDLIDGLRNEVIQIEGDLTSRVALGPENGGSGEHEKTAFMKGLLERLEPDVLQEIKAPDERAQDGYRPNLIATWGNTWEEPTVWVLSHSDIVPPGDLGLWESDPYEVKVDGDRVIGRGVEDNQHGFVSPYLALKAVFESGLKLQRPVGLAVVADEETGSDYGLSYLLKNSFFVHPNSVSFACLTERERPVPELPFNEVPESLVGVFLSSLIADAAVGYDKLLYLLKDLFEAVVVCVEPFRMHSLKINRVKCRNIVSKFIHLYLPEVLVPLMAW